MNGTSISFQVNEDSGHFLEFADPLRVTPLPNKLFTVLTLISVEYVDVPITRLLDRYFPFPDLVISRGNSRSGGDLRQGGHIMKDESGKNARCDEGQR